MSRCRLFSLAVFRVFFALGLLACTFVATAQTITLRGSAVASGNSGSLSITEPGVAAANDLLLVQVAVRGLANCAAITPPAGWTQVTCNVISGTLVQGVYRKLATGADLAQSFTWTFASNRFAGTMLVYRGANTSTPVDAFLDQTNTTASTTATAPTITTSISNDIVVALFSVPTGGLTITPAGSLVNRATTSNGGGGGVTVEAADMTKAVAGATGAQTATISSSLQSIGALVALKLPASCSSNVVSGNWSVAGTWINCRGGIPLAGDTVTINNGHSITLDANPPSLSLLTNNGALSDGGVARTLIMTGNIVNAGTLSLSSSSIQIAGAATWSGAGGWSIGTIDFNWQNQALTLASGATFILNLYGTTPIDKLSAAQGSFNAGGTNTTATVNLARAGDQTVRSDAIIYPNLTLSGSGNKTPDAWAALDVRGDFTVGNSVSYRGDTNSSDVNLYGNLINNGTFNNGWGVFTFRGAAPQSITGATSFLALVLNNASGLTLNSDVTIAGSGTLTLQAGKIVTGSNQLIVAPTCDNAWLTRAAGTWINGNLSLTGPTWSVTCTFYVGDANNYAPITFTYPWHAAPLGGAIIGSTTAGDHADTTAGTSGIDKNKSVNRTWSLALGSGASYYTYDATFQFCNAVGANCGLSDVDVGSTPASFIVAEKVGSSWSTPTTSTAGATSTKATSIASFGTFAVGQAIVSLPLALADYHFDECTAYADVAGEIVDSVGLYSARAKNSLRASSAPQVKLNGYGAFSTYDKYALAGGSGIPLSAAWTVSAWFRAPTTWPSNTGSRYYVLASLAAGGDIIRLDDNNSNKWQVKDGGGTTTTGTYSFSSLAAGWHHLTLAGSGGSTRLYIDGALVDTIARQATASGSLLYIGTSKDNVGTASAEGWRMPVDEFLVFGSALSATQIAAIYANQQAGQNYDGSTRSGGSCLTCVSDTFAGAGPSAPNSVNWNVQKVSGSFTPAIVGDRLRITDITNNVATRVTNNNLFPFGNNLVVAEFDYWAYGGSGADGIAITFSNPDLGGANANNPPTAGGFGGSLGYANRDSGGCTVSGFTGGWLGVGIDEYGNYSNPTECRNGGPGARVNAVSMRGSGSGAGNTVNNYAYRSGTAALGANGVSSGNSTTAYRYRITLDSLTDVSKVLVTVEQNKNAGAGYQQLLSYDLQPLIAAGTQAALPPKLQFTYTGSTGGATNYHEVDNLQICAAAVILAGGADHIRIEHDGAGGVCTREAVVFKACADSTCSTLYAGGATTLTPTTTPAGGTWYTAATGGSPVSSITIPSGGSATYYLAYATPNDVTLGASTVSPAASNGVKCNNTAISLVNTTTACVNTFSDISYVLSEDASSKIAGTYVAVAGRAHDFTVTAIKWDGSTALPAGCGTATGYAGAVSTKMSLTRATTDPGGSAPTIAGTSIPDAATTATIPLTFTSGVATFNLATSDVGKYTLNILDDSKAYSKSNVSVGGGQDLTVRPFALAIWNVASGATANPAPAALGTALDTAVSRFVAAGDPFGATIGGYRHSTTADTNDDGVPDSAATLAQTINGGAAPSFSLATGAAAGKLNLLASRYYNALDTAADPAYISTALDGNECPGSTAVGKELCAPGANAGSLTTGTITFASGVASPAAMSFSEVGFFKLVGGGSAGAAVTSYLGTSGVNLVPAVFSNANSSSSTATQNHTVGRFTPKYFVLANGFLGNRADLVTTGSITSGSTALTVASATGLAVGMTLTVAGAGTSGGGHTATVTALAGTTATLLAPAVTTVVGATVFPDSFTYMDEPFFASFQLTAVNTAGNTTQNYTGTFARLSGVSDSWTSYNTNPSFGMGAVSGTTPLSARIGSIASPTGSFANGVGTFTANMALSRLAAPDGPYATTSIGVRPLDADGVPLSAYNLDAQGTTTADAPDGTNERGLLGSLVVRFGRLWLGNAYGSDRASLSMPYQFQFWNGSAFVTNVLDRRSALSAAAANIGLGNYQNAITSTNMGIAKFSVGANVGGVGTIAISAPVTAASGSVDAVVDLGVSLTAATSWTPTVAPTVAAGMPYLRGKWYGASYDRDPTARATFGVFGSSLKKGPIYIRENF